MTFILVTSRDTISTYMLLLAKSYATEHPLHLTNTIKHTWKVNMKYDVMRVMCLPTPKIAFKVWYLKDSLDFYDVTY